MRTLNATIILFAGFIIACNQSPTSDVKTLDAAAVNTSNGGFGSKEKWGEHLVTIAACHDCHSPKKKGSPTMDLDSSRLLSGHPADMPSIDANRQEAEKKGLIVTNDLTTWVGPWGISYTANITSDSTGIGNWREEQFFKVMREGKYKGLDNNRPILPPMPWPVYKYMTDDELKAIFAYLKSTKPIRNVVPPPQPPVTAAR
jgi:hypothetical protein